MWYATHDLTIPQLDESTCDTGNNHNPLILDATPSGQKKYLFGILVKKTTIPTRHKDYSADRTQQSSPCLSKSIQPSGDSFEHSSGIAH